jgi:hypothetical protein
LLSWSVPLARTAPPKPKITEPQLLSVFPSIGQRNTKVEAEVRGNLLDSARLVWFEDTGLAGRILTVEKLPEEAPAADSPKPDQKEPTLAVYRVSIELDVGAGSALGNHLIRLITPAGLSTAVTFRVVDEPVILEATGPHQTAASAQPVRLPVLINGRLDRPGQLDFYSFEAKQGQAVSVQLSLQRLASEKVDADLAMYQAGGSWFDANRPTRVLFEEEKSSDLMPAQTRGTFRAPRDGRYFLEVSSIFGKGTPDISYRLHISPQPESRRDDERVAAEWSERSFLRKLGTDRIKSLEARSAAFPEPSAVPTGSSASSPKGGSTTSPAPEAPQRIESAPVPVVEERESSGASSDPKEIAIPAIVEGAIRRPGEIDRYRFRAKPGQKLAFEIETPDQKPPQFNPRFSIEDTQDRELFSNVHRRVSLFNNNSDRQVYLRGVEPKAIYTFEKAGEYVLQVRDITSRYAGADYRYRIFVRPQVPHVGEVVVEPNDRINLVRGQSKKLSIKATHEEGFSGDVTFSFAGLPDGVAAFPAAEANEKRDPIDVDENADAVAPKVQTVAVVLMADASAPVTDTPVTVQVLCRPIAGGRPGPSLPVRKIPLMVVPASGK